ncbi:MAG TPA: hypothetical protein PKI89_10170, partial [Tepidiformaceae bacterium]|nr:hypothetical protein [Tepidiformaceae bacterium]
MPRLPLLNTAESVPAEARETYETIIRNRGAVTTPVALLMHAPGTALHSANLGAYFRFESGLALDLFELTIIVAAREFDCEFIWTAHAPLAVKEGVPQAVVDA